MSSISNPSCHSLRSGLSIDIPTLDSASLERTETGPTSRTLSASTFFLPSRKQPILKRTTSNLESNASNMCPQPISGLDMGRSSTGMRDLLFAEPGGELVGKDALEGGTGFKQGAELFPGLACSGGTTSAAFYPSSAVHTGRHSLRPPKAGNGQHISRHATLLSRDVTPARNAAELKSLLGNSKLKIKSGAKLLLPSDISHLSSSTDSHLATVTLEQGKSRARVEVDILLDSGICVEGGYLSGRLLIKVRKLRAKETAVLLGGGKRRVVGFEGIPDKNQRHIFYQHSTSLSTISASSHILYASSPDDEGFSRACEGQHLVPFAMKLPISEDIHAGAKGSFDDGSGVTVKYIVIASFKLKDAAASRHSIAHFYRQCEVHPYYKISCILAPAARPLLSVAARSIFMGGPGKIKLTANLHRNVWVAGQMCCVGIAVFNESKKSVKGLTLSLIRTITIFSPRPNFDATLSSFTDLDAYQTTTARKLVAETTLEAGQRGLRGHVTEKGWWIGIEPGMRARFTHFILLPHDTLSVVRSRLLEVSYAIRVSLIAGSLSSEVSVMLPLRIINNLSIDPPPSCPTPLNYSGIHASKPALPIPAVGTKSACSILQVSPRSENLNGPEERTIPDLCGRTAGSNEVSGSVLAPYAAAANAVPDCILPSQLDGDTDGQDTGDSPSICTQSDDLSEDSRDLMSKDSSDDNYLYESEDSGAHDMVDEDHIDDFAMILLRDLRLDDEVDDDGPGGIGDCNRRKLITTTEIPEAVDYVNAASRTFVSVGKSTGMRFEDRLSRLPRNLANLSPREKLMGTTPLRPRQSSIFEVDSGCSRPSEVHMARSHIGEPSSKKSWHGNSPFSQRMEKLMATRLAAGSGLTNSVTGTKIETCSSVPVDKNVHLPTFAIPLTQGTSLRGLASSASASIRCPQDLTSSSSSQMVMSEATTSGRVAGSFLGTVRSRVAELEGRAAVAEQGRRGKHVAM